MLQIRRMPKYKKLFGRTSRHFFYSKILQGGIARCRLDGKFQRPALLADSGLLGGHCGNYRNLLFAAIHPFELHDACGCSEKSIVRTPANIETGQELGAALANKNFAGFHGLLAIAFYAKSLAVTISSVY